MKGWQKTFVALLVLGGLGWWVALHETTPVEAAKDRIWKAKADDVVKFEVKDLVTGLAIACEKDKDGDWRLTAPAVLEADREACELAARHLAEPEMERKLDAADDLLPYGLKEPKVRAAFTDRKGKSRAMFLGVKTPTDSGYFCLEDGGTIPYVIATWSADSFRKTVADLRQKTLLKLVPAEVTALTLRRATGGTIELARQGADAWRLVKPVAGAADRFAVDGLLNDLKDLKGADVLDDPLAYSRHKLDQPTAEVVVTGAKGARQTLTLSRPDPKRDEAWASSTRLPFTWRLAGAAALTNVLKPLDDFRDRLLLQLDREALTGAEVTVAGTRYVLAPGAGGTWKVVEPAGTTAAETELNDMLFELLYVRAEAFVDDAPKSAAKHGLAPPRVEVLLRAKVDKKAVTYRYRLGALSRGHVLLAFGDAATVYGVRQDLLDKIEGFAAAAKAAPTPAAAPKKK